MPVGGKFRKEQDLKERSSIGLLWDPDGSFFLAPDNQSVLAFRQLLGVCVNKLNILGSIFQFWEGTFFPSHI